MHVHVTTTKYTLIFKYVFILLKTYPGLAFKQKKISWLRDGRKPNAACESKKYFLPPIKTHSPPPPPRGFFIWPPHHLFFFSFFFKTI